MPEAPLRCTARVESVPCRLSFTFASLQAQPQPVAKLVPHTPPSRILRDGLTPQSIGKPRGSQARREGFRVLLGPPNSRRESADRTVALTRRRWLTDLRAVKSFRTCNWRLEYQPGPAIGARVISKPRERPVDDGILVASIPARPRPAARARARDRPRCSRPRIHAARVGEPHTLNRRSRSPGSARCPG